MRNTVTIALCAVGLCAAAAQDAPPTDYDIIGSWEWDAGPLFDGQCSFVGVMNVTPTDDGRLDCALTAEQFCEGWSEAVVAEQACTLRIRSTAIMIDSTVVSVSDGSSTWDPDNFTVRFTGPHTMSGVLRWSGPQQRAVFFRASEQDNS